MWPVSTWPTRSQFFWLQVCFPVRHTTRCILLGRQSIGSVLITFYQLRSFGAITDRWLTQQTHQSTQETVVSQDRFHLCPRGWRCPALSEHDSSWEANAGCWGSSRLSLHSGKASGAGNIETVFFNRKAFWGVGGGNRSAYMENAHESYMFNRYFKSEPSCNHH